MAKFKKYYQTDGEWEYLCRDEGDFEKYGCGVCCAAMLTQYKERGTKDPSVMKERGVFTSTNLTTQWGKMSDEFTLSSTQEYKNDLKGALKEIKNQIDTYSDPVVLRISNDSVKHFVVAYDYEDNCDSAADVLIGDPCKKADTLEEAFEKWPNFLHLRRIIDK